MKRFSLIIGLMLLSNSSLAVVKKHNPDTEFKAAQTRSWQPDQMEQASRDFRVFLKKYPNYREAYIAYANVESWQQNFRKAFSLLEDYKERFGVTPEYLSAKARMYSLAGYYDQALTMNAPLLAANPYDYDLVYTNANALYKARRFSEARRELQKLKKLQPKNNDTTELENIFNSLAESVLATGVNYYTDNQTIRNWSVPVAVDWAINDNTHFLFQGAHEVLTADKSSGAEAINGDTSIYDNSFLAGIKWRAVPRIAISGMAGDLKIKDLSDKFIYLANANFAIAETTNLDLLHFHNLYRPYLYPTSPKAVSLGIMEDLYGGRLYWQPVLEMSINTLASYSHLSDGNHYIHIDIAPMKQFVLNSKMNFTLGGDVELLCFAEQLNNGYYDPRFHQQFLATTGFNYNPITQLSCNISVGAGTHQDHETDGFKPAYSAYAGIAYLFGAWEIALSGDYTYQGAAFDTQSYEGLSLQARVALRI